MLFQLLLLIICVPISSIGRFRINLTGEPQKRGKVSLPHPCYRVFPFFELIGRWSCRHRIQVKVGMTTVERHGLFRLTSECAAKLS